jgi:hypothetical protein
MWKDFYCFADGHPIHLDRLDHFATQVIAIRLGHGRDGKGATFLVYVLMQLATAIAIAVSKRSESYPTTGKINPPDLRMEPSVHH